MAKQPSRSEKRHKFQKQFKANQARLGSGRVQTRALEDLVMIGENASAQAGRLNDSRLPNAQRQALATQIGQVQGNQHLQRVVGLLQRAQEEVKEEDEEKIQTKRENAAAATAPNQPGIPPKVRPANSMVRPLLLSDEALQETIQRKSSKDTDGSQYLEMTIPDGTYALEAANIPATLDWSVE